MKLKHLPLYRDFEAKSAEISDNGTIHMVASTVGNADRIGDVLMPGCFGKQVLDQATKKGWIDVAHSWDGLPAGYPTNWYMQGTDLIVDGEFHSTPRAQEVRTIVQERLKAKKYVGVSIGFMPDYSSVKEFDTGEDLLKWAEGAGYDMGQMDAASIKGQRWVWAITKVKEVFEASVCNVGMNPKARATIAKGLTADDQFDEALEPLLLYLEREKDIASLRKRISGAQRDRLEKSVDVLLGLFKSDPAPEPVESTVDEPAEATDVLFQQLAIRTLSLRTCRL
jgi:hypothetical protein